MPRDLRRLLSMFWSGSVTWSRRAAKDLEFWLSLDLGSLRSPVSADTFEALVDGVYVDPSTFTVNDISLFACDASATAGGGGEVVASNIDGLVMTSKEPFFMTLSKKLSKKSSGLRELTVIWWLLQAFQDTCRSKVIVFTDSWVARNAIRYGSKTKCMQDLARKIFLWCVRRGICLCPVWLARDEKVMVEADARSRLEDTHGHSTSKACFARADAIARRLWHRSISFDRMATPDNVMPPKGMGPSLPFNSRWRQPGSAGVDMFAQHIDSWRGNINFVHPPVPLIGRVCSFLSATDSRSIVIVPEHLVHKSWWASYVLPASPHVRAVEVVNGMRIVAIDSRVEP